MEKLLEEWNVSESAKVNIVLLDDVCAKFLNLLLCDSQLKETPGHTWNSLPKLSSLSLSHSLPHINKPSG
jgi:hypothetical protein